MFAGMIDYETTLFSKSHLSHWRLGTKEGWRFSQGFWSETGIRYTTRKSQRLLARLKLQRIMAMWKWALKIIQDGEMPFPVGLSSDGFSKSLVDLSFDT